MRSACRTSVALGCLALLACGQGGVAPPPGGLDGGAVDGGPVVGEDAGVPPRPGRADGGLVLPGADATHVLPYMGETRTEPIEVGAEPGQLDVHFSVDTTGSFGEEIDAMQAGLGTLVDTLEARVDEVSFGVSRFEDFPVDPFGAPEDRPFELLGAVTSDRGEVAEAMGRLDRPLGQGGDPREAGAEALYQVATGEGRPAPFPIEPFGAGDAAPGGGAVGGVGFRESALRVVVHVTDAPSHSPGDYAGEIDGTHSLDQAIEALRGIGARGIGIASRSGGDGSFPRAELEELALGTGAVVDPVDGGCPTGIGGAVRAPREGVCPLVFDVAEDGSGLSDALAESILALLAAVAYDEAYGVALEDRLGFVQSIEAVDAEPAPGATAPTRADRRPAGDGVDDTFLSVAAGTRLTFAVRLRNVTLPPQDYEQVFRVPIAILGDGQLLAERTLRIIVPPN